MIDENKVRIWATIPKDTKTTIDKLIPLLEVKTIGDVIDLAITSFAIAVSEYIIQQNKTKEENKDEIN